MSHIVFGCFNTDKFKMDCICELKKNTILKQVYFWFDSEIDFYPDILLMRNEQKAKGKCAFSMTSKNQQYNSDDLLFPYDKFTNEQLFADETRKEFNKYCRQNLKDTFDCLQEFIYVFNPKDFEIFITDVYDNKFNRKKMNLDEIERDSFSQVISSFSLESSIYSVSL